jgi:Matrixin
MKKQIIFTLALLIVVASAVPAMAYSLLSPRRRWASTPVSVPVYNAGHPSISDSDGGVSAVAGAIKAWGIVNSGTTNTAAKRGVAPATITLNSAGGVCGGNCLAATLIGYYSGSTIQDADVYTSQRHPFFSSRESDGCSGEYDIDGVMVHEVGHVLGIAHSDVQGATMYPSVSACNIANRTLERDDTAAKSDLY